MTNANVASVVKSAGGNELTLEYKDGSQKILVPDGTPIVDFVPGDRSLLVPGATIYAVAQAADGKIADRPRCGEQGRGQAATVSRQARPRRRPARSGARMEKYDTLRVEEKPGDLLLATPSAAPRSLTPSTLGPRSTSADFIRDGGLRGCVLLRALVAASSAKTAGFGVPSFVR